MTTLHTLILLVLCVFYVYTESNVIGSGINTSQNLGRNITASTISTLGTIAGDFTGETFVSVSVGYDFTVFLTASGKVFGCGSTSAGRLGLNDSTLSTTIRVPTPMIDGENVLTGKTIKDVQASTRVTVLLASDGKVYTTGSNVNGGLGVASTVSIHKSPKPIYDPNQLLANRTVVGISTANDAVVMVTDDGLIRSFGYGGLDLIGDGGAASRYQVVQPTDFFGHMAGKFFIQVSVGYSHVIALAKDGTVLTWGTSSFPDALGRTGAAVYPGKIFDNNNQLVNRNATYVSAGKNFNLIVTNDGRVLGFGENGSYQCCTGTSGIINYPTRVHASLNDVFFVKAAAGGFSSMLLSSNGSVYVCGDASSGALPLNRTSPSPVIPEKVSTLSGFFGGYVSNVALSSHGAVAGFVVMNASATPATPAPTAPTTTTVEPTAPSGSITQTFTRQGTLSRNVTGDATKIPSPATSTSLVLFSNASVTTSLPCQFNGDVPLPSNAMILSSTLNINVNVNKPATIAVIFSDEFGEQAVNITQQISTSGAIAINTKDLYARLLQLYQQSFTIRIIRGSIIKVSLGIQTSDVAVSVEPTVTSTTTYATPQTASPTPTPTGTPSTTKVSAGSTISLSFIMLLFIILIN